MEHKKSVARQLNPFALPTETDARFILLMISAPALAFTLSFLLRYIFSEEATSPFAMIPPALSIDLPPNEYFQAQIEFGTQIMLASMSALILPFFLIGLTFLLAAVFYRDHPRRIRRQKGAVPFSPQTDPRFAQELAALSAQAGLQTVPMIGLGKQLTAQSGQAFGVGRKKSLYLDAGLRLLLRKSVENFRAIIRHELAHIVNHDIGRTYFAQSLWIAVAIITIMSLIVASLYLVLSSSYSKIVDELTSAELQNILFVKLPTFFGLSLRSVGLIIVILLIRAGLLRTREHYADWRAALWGSAPTLASIFEAQSQRRKTGLNPFRLHPYPAERLNTLKKPRLLFDIHFDVPFVVGVFTSLVLNGLIDIVIHVLTITEPGILALISALVRYTQLHSDVSVLSLLPLIYGLQALNVGVRLLVTLLPFLILGSLAATTLGLQVQRQSLADLADGRSGIRYYVMLALPAAWMGLGMVVGILLSPPSILNPNSLINALIAVFYLLAFVFFVWLTLVYTRFFSIRLLGSHAKFTLPRGKNRLLSVLVAVLFLAVETPLILGYLAITQTGTLDTLQALLLLMGITIGMLILMSLTFAFHWIVWWFYRRIRPVRCPSCRAISPESAVVGRNCVRCGESMVPWLYVVG